MTRRIAEGSSSETFHLSRTPQVGEFVKVWHVHIGVPQPVIEQLPVNPSDPMKLVAEGSTLFRADVSTAPVTVPAIVQGSIEDSNVQPVLETTRMMDGERQFQFLMQFIQSESERQQSAIDKLLSPVA